MARQHPVEDLDVPAEDALGLLGGPHRRFEVSDSDSIPLVCKAADVARILGVSDSQVHRLHRQHKLDAFLLPQIGKHVRYSGRLLREWAEGRLAVVNGDVNRPRVFGGSRQTAAVRLRSSKR